MAKSDTKTYETKDFTITIDRSKCISCGTCAALAPNIFELDKDLISQVKKNAQGSVKEALEAAQSCAVDAITVFDKKTGKKLWPK